MKALPRTPAVARRLAGFLLLTSLATGCSLPGQKLAACRAEKQQLLARIQQDQDRLLALEAEKRQTDERLAQAEKSLALLHDSRSGIERIAGIPESAAGVTGPAPSTPPARAPDDAGEPSGGGSDPGAWTQRTPADRR